jgi:hypothetical protein
MTHSVADPSHRATAVARLLLAGAPPLIDVCEHIVREPHRGIVQQSIVVALEDAADPDMERLVELVDDPRAVAPAPDDPVHFEVDGLPCRFAELPDRRVLVGVDTVPNRFAKWLFERCLRLLAHAPPEHTRLRNRLAVLARSGTFSAVASLSTVTFDDPLLRRDRRYARLLALHTALARLTAS